MVHIFLLLYKEWMSHNLKLSILCLHLPAGQHSKSKHNNTVCKFHYRRHLMISAIRCGENFTYIYQYRYWLSAKWVVKYWCIGYWQTIQYRAFLLKTQTPANRWDGATELTLTIQTQTDSLTMKTANRKAEVSTAVPHIHRLSEWKYHHSFPWHSDSSQSEVLAISTSKVKPSILLNFL